MRQLNPSKWFTVAFCEYLVTSSGIRSIRPHIKYATLPLLAIWVFLISPIISNPLAEIIFVLPSDILTILFQILYFFISLCVVTIPVIQTFKENKTGQMEVLMAAPIKPGDILLGEFIGQSPFYAILLTFIAGLISAIFFQGVSHLITLIIVLTFLFTNLTSLWIGTLVSVLLRTKLGTYSKGRDWGKALGFLIVLPIIAIMYFFTSGMAFRVFADPTYGPLIRSTLNYLPSSWAADLAFFLTTEGVDTLFIITRITSLILFSSGVFIIGVKAAHRFYSLEPSSFSSTMVNHDGLFYRLLKVLGGGGTSGALLVNTFKDYIRKVENISKLVYTSSLLLLMLFFNRDEIILGNISELIFIISAVMASFIVGEITIQGKSNLFIYKKAPRGIFKLIKTRLIHGGFMVAGLTGLLTFSIGIIFSHATLDKLLWITISNAASAVGGVLLSLGLFLINPAFTDKSPNYAINIMIAPNIIFMVTIVTSTIPYAVPLGVWVLALIILTIGVIRIKEIE